MPPERRLVVTARAASFRRALAPSAWVVLEELALAADPVGIATTNSRRLAGDLGLSKDTASRAVQRLIAAGLVERIERRDDSTGRFRAIAYRVDLAAAGLLVQPVDDTRAEPAAPTPIPTAPPRMDPRGRSTSRVTRRPIDLALARDDERSGPTADSGGRTTQHRPTTAPTSSSRRAARAAANDSSDGTDQLELFGPDTTARPDLASDRDD
jgi:DNA-binding transcriptional MocR family regulator